MLLSGVRLSFLSVCLFVWSVSDLNAKQAWCLMEESAAPHTVVDPVL